MNWLVQHYRQTISAFRLSALSLGLLTFGGTACLEPTHQESLLADARGDHPELSPFITKALAQGIVVAGLSSTLVRDQEIEFYDQKIPATYSGHQVKNTPTFAWWVSKHYALKTDYPADKAKFYLELLELAYPHYVALFGREIPEIGTKKMTVVYASSKATLSTAMISDGLSGNLDAGGITMEGRKVAYQFPSGGLEYHQRYILLHEAVHLYQMCLYGSALHLPLWFVEGIADMVSSHVYHREKRQLTTSVFDKPTIHNYADEGLTTLAGLHHSFQDRVQTAPMDRGVNFLMAHYFYSDPDRRQKMRQWVDGMYQRPAGETAVDGASRLFEQLFAPWPEINGDFAAWVSERHNTFHYVEWGWEQNGESMVSYGFPSKGQYARTDVLLNLGDQPSLAALQMDYPRQPQSELVGPVRRGVAEPSIGALLDFSRDKNRGLVGLGFGVDAASDSYGTVLIDSAKNLLFDFTALAGPKQSVALTPELKAAITQGNWLIGMTVTLERDQLLLVLKAKGAGGVVSQSATLALTSQLRQLLNSRPMAILARGGYHGVTPYLDVKRPDYPDLLQPAPANRQLDPHNT